MEHRYFIIQEYLKTPLTNYACIIDGEWGSGKTYWLKNNIKPLIEKTETIIDASINYRCIHVSLYGVNSISELQSKIFYEVFHLLKNTKLKATIDIVKILGDTYLKYHKINGADKLFQTIENHTKSSLSMNKLVICFDDLERKGSNLNINELSGYINDLTENVNAKILILLNYDKISEISDIRGKVDGLTIKYEPNISQVIKSIISLNYSASNEYSEFLINQIDYLIQLHTSGLKNLRYFIYGFNKFRKIFSTINNVFVGEKENLYLKKILLEDCFVFTISICYEFKEGKKADEIKEVLNSKNWISGRNKKSDDSVGDRSERAIFFEKYYFKSGYKYFNSLINYLLGVEDFSIVDFEVEIKTRSNYNNVTASVEDQLLLDLRPNDCFKFPDGEILLKMRSLLEKAKNGLYPLDKYTVIFSFLTQFDNPLQFDKNVLVDELKVGMNTSFLKNPTHVKGFDHGLGVINQDDPNLEFYESVFIYAQKLNDETLSIESNNRSKDLYKNFISDPNDFIEIYLNDEKTTNHYISIFSEFKPDETLNLLLCNNKLLLHSFITLINFRYRVYFKEFEKDLQFLSNLSNEIYNSSLQSEPIKKFLLNKLQLSLSKSLEVINNGMKKS